MSAEDREQKRGKPSPQSAPPASGVSMRALLASCAAADAVSKPPSDGEEGAKRGGGDGRSKAAVPQPELQPEQDAA